MGHREPLARLDTEPLVGRLDTEQRAARPGIEPRAARLDTEPCAARPGIEPLVARLYSDHGMQSSATCKLSRAAEPNDAVRR